MNAASLVRLMPPDFEDKRYPGFTLVHATVIIRHGLRTPLHRIDEVEWDCKSSKVLHHAGGDATQSNELFQLRPVLNQDDLRGSCYPGQLTRMGFDQHVKLGSLLRARYVGLGLLPESFNRSQDILYVRSTQYDRTIASAEALLTGLYPPSFRAWGDDGQIEINLRHTSHENMYPRVDSSCPALVALFKKHPQKQFGAARLTAQELVTTLDTLYLHGHPQPAGVPSIEEIHRQSALDHAILYGNREVSRLGIGNFLSEVWQSLRAPARFSLFSAHDTTILPLLGLLQAPRNDGIEHPPCGSALLLELYRENKTGREHVQILLNAKPVLLQGLTKVAGTDLYLYDDVANMIQPYLLSDNQYKSLCHQ